MKKADERNVNLITIKYPELTMGECKKLQTYIDGDYPDSKILEHIFACFNAGSGQECKTFKEARVRSMSVGDFVCINGQWYQCLNTGWEETTDEVVFGEDHNIRKRVDSLVEQMEKLMGPRS
jgi:hypothetical protein